MKTIEKGTLVKADFSNHILKELGKSVIEVLETKDNKAYFLTHREVVCLPISDLKIADLPYFNSYTDKNGKDVIVVDSRFENNKKVYNQAFLYGKNKGYCSSGSEITCYFIDNKTRILIKFSKSKKSIKVSVCELQNF